MRHAATSARKEARTEAEKKGKVWVFKNPKLAYAMDKYYEIAMKYAAKAEKYYVIQKLSEMVRTQPRNLALGVAEGVLLFKLTFPFTMAAEFYGICRGYLWFKNRGAAGEAQGAGNVEKPSEEKAKTGGEKK